MRKSAAKGLENQGLTEDEAKKRLAQFGPNELAEKEKTPAWKLFLEQFNDFLIIILLAAAGISLVLALLGEGDLLDPILIFIIVLFYSFVTKRKCMSATRLHQFLYCAY